MTNDDGIMETTPVKKIVRDMQHVKQSEGFLRRRRGSIVANTAQ